MDIAALLKQRPKKLVTEAIKAQAAPVKVAPRKPVPVPSAPLVNPNAANGMAFNMQKISDENKTLKEQLDNWEKTSGRTVKQADQVFMTPAQADQFQNMAVDSILPGQTGQREANAELQKQLADLRDFEQAPNLNALGEGLNQLFGYSFKPQAAPETMDDRKKLLVGLQDKLAQNFADQAKFENSLLSQFKIPASYTTVIDSGKQGGANKQQAASVNVNLRGTDSPKGGGKDGELDTRPFADRLAKDQIPRLQTILRSISQKIPGGIRGWNGADLPGFGKGTGALARTVPGLDSFTSDKGALIQDIQEFMNTVTKRDSGATVTPGEAERLNIAQGIGVGKGASHLVQALRRAEDTLNEMIVTRAAGEKPGVLEAYLKRSQNPNIGSLQQIESPPGVKTDPGGTGETSAQMIQRIKAENKKK